MFRQVKSIFFWSLLYKFRQRLTVVALLLSVVILSQWIYSDIVEYLTLTNNTIYLHIILPIKWIIIFFNIGLSVYLILSLFKAENKKADKTNKIEKKDTINIKVAKKNINKSELTNREKEFMTKKIRSEAEIILEKKLKS